MLVWWGSVVAWMPFWAWLIVSAAAFAAFTVAWASALLVISAAGTNHGSLTRRQRRMARYASFASLAAVPLCAAIGLLALLAAAWPLLT